MFVAPSPRKDDQTSASHSGCPHLSRRLGQPALGSPREHQLFCWAGTPVLQHLLQPFPHLRASPTNGEDNRDNAFSSTEGEGAVMVVGDNVKDMEKVCSPACPEFAGLSPLFSSDILACCVYKDCLDVLPLFSHKRQGTSSCLIVFSFLSAVSPHLLFHPSAAQLLEQELSWLFLTSLTFMGDL